MRRTSTTVCGASTDAWGEHMEGTVRFSLNTISSFRHTAEDLERKLEALVRQVNGDKDEMYLDAYKKFENRCIRGEEK